MHPDVERLVRSVKEYGGSVSPRNQTELEEGRCQKIIQPAS